MSKTEKNRKLDCDIVSDLLSLYHDGIVKETTAESVKQHLEHCEICRKEYEELCVELPIQAGEVSVNTKDKFLEMMKKAKRNRRLTSIIALIAICVLLIGGYFLQEQFLIANLSDKYITVYRTYQYQTEEGYKLFVLFSDEYVGSEAFKVEAKERDGKNGLVVNVKKPLFVPSYYYYETYKNIEGLKELGLSAEIWDYEYGYSSGDNGGIECVEFDFIEFGGKVIWSKEENADDIVPEYVYAYEEFHSSTGNIVSWNTNLEVGYLEAIYEDGKVVRWDFDGKVLYEGYVENE